MKHALVEQDVEYELSLIEQLQKEGSITEDDARYLRAHL